MSEDRHLLSEPRLIPHSELEAALAEATNLAPNSNKSRREADGYPAWYVDVYRKGVPDPVETLVINDQTLPPRKNKKGRVVWRLPDAESAKGGRMPNFATDERRRILELFKERKKIRKKSIKKQSNASDPTGGEGAVKAGGGSDEGVKAAGNGHAAGNDDVSVSSSSGGWSRGRIKTADSGSEEPSGGTNVEGGHRVGARPARRKKKNDGSIRKEETDSSGKSVKPGDGGADAGSPPHPQAPPGFRPPSQSAAEADGVKNLGDATARLGLQEEAEVGPDTDPKPPLACRYIVIPVADRPPPPPTPTSPSEQPSMAIPAAKAFVDLYYPHVTHGLSADLALHYTDSAQKSVSVGGAHSVVTGRDNIAMQIASLAGAAFVVRGVVSQDAADGRGAFLLVTGLAQLAPSAGGNVTPFAHSVSLVPVGTVSGKPSYAFQIHNDAFSLLTSDMTAAPTSAPSPAPAVPQPPGFAG